VLDAELRDAIVHLGMWYVVWAFMERSILSARRMGWVDWDYVRSYRLWCCTCRQLEYNTSSSLLKDYQTVPAAV
jgi:hypothetical protein